MGFERIIPMYVQGTSFMGQNLDALYSEKIDEAGLKQWAETLADCVEYFGNNEDGGQAIPFRYVFFFELVDFCLFIAASDGSITPEEVKAIDWLTSGERSLDLEKAMELRTEAEEQCLMRRYPYSFRILVEEVAGGNEDGIMEAGVISRFYLQVARFVHSIDNPGDFDENNPAYLYVSSFDKYVERVSADDFFIPFEEETIEDTLAVWDELVKQEEEGMGDAFCGTWKVLSGNAKALGFSDLVIKTDGNGYMSVKKLFRTAKEPLHWSVEDVAGMPSLVVRIPALGTIVVMTPLDSDKMAAMIPPSKPGQGPAMAILQRANVDTSIPF